MLQNIVKNSIRLASAVSLAAILTGCSREYRTEYSDIKQERSKVVSKKKENGGHTTIGKVSIPLSDRYYITFKGNHEFRKNNRELYQRFELNDSVDVSYRDVYASIYEDKDKDGKKELLMSNFQYSEFVDATPLPEKDN